MPELNHSGCCSPSRLLEPKKNKKLSSAMLTGDRDGTISFQKMPETGCLQNCEEDFETELIQRRNSKDAIGDPRIGCTNNGFAPGDCNGYKERISDTTEEMKSKNVCTKVYYRKNKRCRSAEYFQGQPANRNLDVSHSETASCTGEEEIVLASETASCNLTSGRDFDSGKSCFVSTSNENGLLHGERNGSIVSQTMTWTRYPQISEKHADTQLIETRNDTQPIADSQNGCTNKTSAAEDSNDCRCAKISGTAEDVRESNICPRVYNRKSYKRPRYSPATGYVQIQSSNGDHYASNSGRLLFTAKEDTDVTDKTRTCNLTTGREVDLEKLCHVSILTENGSVSGNNDCMTLSPKSLTVYLQICEKLSNTKLIDIRNDTQPVADSQSGFTSNKLTVEDSTNCKHAKVSLTAEEVRDKRVCMKVYSRKKFKSSNSATGYFQGQSANGDHDASTSEKSVYTTHDNIAGDAETASHDLTPGRDAIFEKLWCISILKENGLLGHFPQRCRVMERQAVVGDGTVDCKCKICDQLEDTRTLICDMCEEPFHISCLNPKLVSNFADNWYCPTCQTRINKDSPCNSKKESKYAYLLRQMLDDNVQHKTCVRIGCDYQAEIPEYSGKPSESSESQSIGFVVSLEEMILEKKLADENLKNNIWEKGWKPANAFPPGTNENWLQCKAIIYKRGDICPDGIKARRDLFCGKWRRAPLSEVQTEKWDCSCAVLWDPHHADCFVPQEIKTTEIQKRNKQSQQRNEVYVSSQRLQE